jgi:fimbrial chaperone protein
MRARLTAIAMTTFFLAVPELPVACAGSLQVAPVSIEMKAPAGASILMLHNSGKAVVKAQIRVFRWSQTGGQEKLEPATDMVASPPMAAVVPGKDSTIRLVRMAKTPVMAEETYRIIVDELPDPARQKTSGLDLAFRYSIPVFVMPQQAGKPDLSWSVETRNGATLITAVNAGDRRIRIADLMAVTAKGKQVPIANGLAGYVLARSSMSWVAPGSVQASGNAPVLITAHGDQGAIHAEARAEAAQ